MVNLTLNDSTQQALLPHLQETEDLLSIVTSKLSHTKKQSEIVAMPDLGIAHNVTRMIGGFYTGAKYSWECDIPFVPVDATVNVCGTALFKLKSEIPINEFLMRINNVLQDKSKYSWNYTNGNHFISLIHSKGDFGFESGMYMIVHASANEFKNGPLGLYPNHGVWYENDINIEYAENSSRYLRYIYGDTAEKFYNIAQMLITFNTERNIHFVQSVLGEYLEKEIVSIQHYGMPNKNTVCIGAHWENSIYPLLTAPGQPIFLIKPNKNFNGSPHGFGLGLKSPNIKYFNKSIQLDNKVFKFGEKINIGQDALVRCSSPNENLETYINNILKVCPGKIIGKFEQIISISKDGINVW